MKVKVFQPNSQGKIEFTRTELEKLLNEVYNSGFYDGEIAQQNKSTWTWISPHMYSNTITSTNSTNNINGTSTCTIDNYTKTIIDNLDDCTGASDKLTGTYDSATSKNDTSTAKNAAVDIAPISITLGNMDREAAKKHISDTVAALRRAQAAPGDVFTNLAKELNF